MKLKLKIMCAVLMLVGVCAPAFSTDYAPIFRKMMKVEPAKASIEQMRNFYNKSPWSNEAKAEMMVQMASWKGIAMYTRDSHDYEVPNVNFLDFALTIENQLYAEEDSILDPIYRNTILEHVFPEAKDAFNKNWQKNVDKVLGNKTVRVREIDVRASWVARCALFQAALRYSTKHIISTSPHSTTYWGDALKVFAVNNMLFGANSVTRKELMSEVLKSLTELVTLSYVKDLKGLYTVETIMKRNGGEGLNPRDPNLKKITESQSKNAKKRVRQRMNTSGNIHESKMSPWRLLAY